jgi:nitronate monooxygenase
VGTPRCGPELDWPPGYSGRALADQFTAKWHGNKEQMAVHLDTEKERFWTAMRGGDVNTAVVFVGEGVDLICSIKPASEAVVDISEGTEVLLCNAPSSVLE